MEGLEAFNASPLIRNYLSSFQGAGRVFEYPQNQQQVDSSHMDTYDDHAFHDDTDVVSIDSGDSNKSKQEAEVLDSHPLAVTTKKSSSSLILKSSGVHSSSIVGDCPQVQDGDVAAPLLSPAPTHALLHNKPAAGGSSMIPAAYQSEWDELRSNVLALTGSSAASSSAGTTPQMMVNGMLSPADSASKSDTDESFILSYINTVLKGQLKQKQVEVTPPIVQTADHQPMEEEDQVSTPIAPSHVEEIVMEVSDNTIEKNPVEEADSLAANEAIVAENIPATEKETITAAVEEEMIVESEVAVQSELIFEEIIAVEEAADMGDNIQEAYDPFAIFRRDDEDSVAAAEEDDNHEMHTNTAVVVPEEATVVVVVPLTVLQQQHEQYKVSLQTSIVETSRSKPPLHPGTKKVAAASGQKRRREVNATNAEAIIGEPRPKRVAVLQSGQSAVAKRDGCLGSWPSRKQSAASGDWVINSVPAPLLPRPVEDDCEEYEVEEIRGHTKVGRTYTFTTKWMGFEDVTEEPYKNLKYNEVLHDYLQKIGLQSLVPAQFRK